MLSINSLMHLNNKMNYKIVNPEGKYFLKEEKSIRILKLLAR